MSTTWMVYGATGYTGRLIAAQATREGLTPILAGRERAAVEALAKELELEARTFALDDPAALREALAGVTVVAHCAGPFSATSAPLRAACRAARCHYVDITGEIAVFEAAHAEDARAREAGVVVCPGVGFDVIPTDCVAACLKSALPDATSLALGFDSDSGLSRGTALTAVEGLGQGLFVRRGGALRRVPLGHGRRRIDFGRGLKTAVAIPWGDASAQLWMNSAGVMMAEAWHSAEARPSSGSTGSVLVHRWSGRPQRRGWAGLWQGESPPARAGPSRAARAAR